MKLLFFDLETTGLVPTRHSIHQISGCIEINGEERECFNFNVAPNPNMEIEEEALFISNKTKEEVLSYPNMNAVYKEFINLLEKYVDKENKSDRFFLVGYNNSSFDNHFLRQWFLQNNDNSFSSWFWPNSLDVYVLATQKFMKERHKIKDFKLKTVSRYAGIDVDEEKMHDAIYDIEITRKLYKILIS